jgi:serine/threonine-protein kinase RsbW
VGAAVNDEPDDRRNSPILRLELRLSRDTASVGLARRILESVLQAMAIDEQRRDALVLALSEGCANAVQHAVGADGYQVRVSFDENCCVVDILDTGRSVPRLLIDRPMPHVTAEGGRGLSIMAMSTDSLHMTLRRPHGLAVRFTKRLA